MDRNGYFDGSEDAAGYVELKIAGLPGRHLLSQFAGRLRYPGLARAAFSGATERAPIALDPPSLSVSTRDGAFGIELRAARGLRSLDVYIDGRLARRIPVTGVAASLALDPKGLPPAAFATLLAIDSEGFTSPPTEIVLGTRPSEGRGRLLGFAVGVDLYPKMPGSDLRYAAADARRIAGAVAASPLYGSAEIDTLIDADATAEAILARLDAVIAEAGEGDTLLLSFAGHGLIGGDGRLRLALSSTDRADIDRTSLAFDAVAQRIKAAKARVVVLLDSCHSGVTGQADPATNEDAVAQLVTEGGAGIVILSASKGRQFSEELATLGGGRFSVAIEDAVTAGRAKGRFRRQRRRQPARALQGREGLSRRRLLRAADSVDRAQPDLRRLRRLLKFAGSALKAPHACISQLRPILSTPAANACISRPAQPRRPWNRHGRVSQGPPPSALRLRAGQPAQGQRAGRGRRHHRPRHGQSRPADAEAHRRQAGRGGARPAHPPLLVLARHSRPAPAQASYYGRRFGVKLNPDTQVVATLGSKEGFANMAQAITAPGDVVLCPNPTYPIHAFGFIMSGGVIRSMPVEPDEDFIPALERGVRTRSRSRWR
jgi:hypothetical protein